MTNGDKSGQQVSVTNSLVCVCDNKNVPIYMNQLQSKKKTLSPSVTTEFKKWFSISHTFARNVGDKLRENA